MSIQHHTVRMWGIALGEAFGKALGDEKSRLSRPRVFCDTNEWVAEAITTILI